MCRLAVVDAQPTAAQESRIDDADAGGVTPVVDAETMSSGRCARHLDNACSSIRCMRTTLSLDDDVLLAVQERARREKRTTGQVLSDLARQALTGQHRQPEDTRTEHHGFRPLPRRGAAISNALIDRLREDEAE